METEANGLRKQSRTHYYAYMIIQKKHTCTHFLVRYLAKDFYHSVKRDSSTHIHPPVKANTINYLSSIYCDDPCFTCINQWWRDKLEHTDVQSNVI